jgi:restriction system protein
MPVPTYDKLIEPIRRYLAAHPDGAVARHVHEATAATPGLSEADKQALLPSGEQPIDKNRAGWAHGRLKRAGLSASMRRGFWRLTPGGLTFAANNPQPLPDERVEELATGNTDIRLRNAGPPPQPQDVPQPLPRPSSLTMSPDDRLEDALAELRQTGAAEVLERFDTRRLPLGQTGTLPRLRLRRAARGSTADR